jgi:gas vesicle protein
MSENNSNSVPVGGYLAAFAIGAALGAGIALLYAPRSGKETREILAKKGLELKDKAEDVLEEAKDFIRSKKQEVTAAVEAGKEAIREERAKHQKNS